MHRRDPMRERARHEAAQRQPGQVVPPKVTADDAQPYVAPEGAPTRPAPTAQPGPLPKPLIR